MRICTKGALEWNSEKQRYQKIEEECEYQDYEGPISECKGGGGGGTTVQKTEPPEYMMPYLIGGGNDRTTGVLKEAQNLYRNYSPSYFQGETVSPFSSETEQSLSQKTRLAQDNPYSQPSQQLVTDTLSGKYLDVTPQLQAQVNRIIPGVNSQFARAGRAGSGLAQTAVAEQVSNAAAGLMNEERQRQMQTLGLLPSLNQARYGDAQALAQVGAQREDYAQQLIDAEKAKFDYEQNLPYWKLQQYNSIVQPQIGSGSLTTSQQPVYRPNRVAGAAGGALTGATLGSIVPGIGTGIGALVGGGLGLLGVI